MNVLPQIFTTSFGGRVQLRELVIHHVQSSVVAGLIRPGDKVRPADVARELAISATPAREGLLLLAHDGWLVLEPNRGFRVARRRRRDIEDILLISEFV